MLPFDDSRRLTGPNLYFTSTGAVLEVIGVAADSRLLDGWRARVERAFRRLGWRHEGEPASVRARPHASGASLALAAPFDRLFTATEVNEWALSATALELDPSRWTGIEDALRVAAADSTPTTPIAPVIDERDAMARFEQLAALEARPSLRSLVRCAATHRISHVLDESLLTLGSGAGSRTWPLDGLPREDEVRWADLRDIPIAAVTGSNGKTTTVRLVAACAREHGWASGFSCTDGLFIGDESVASGDYSGPVGARTILRDRRVEAAVLETARGGILRRGLAFERANAAVVTNVSSDHFGEYGIHDLDGLADAKLTVAALLDSDGLLVLNADDPLLVAKSRSLAERFARDPPLGWFALDAQHPVLQRNRARGGATCGVRDARLVLHYRDVEQDLGPVDRMPLTVQGAAHYNVSNLAAAALAAAAMGIPAPTISRAFLRFGADAADNPGRMMSFRRDGVQVLVDYAHNPESLRGILRIAQQLRGAGRVGMLLGHAGNRQDSDLRQVAATAAQFQPDLVVVKESEAHLRGRAPGEVPRIIRDELLRLGLPESSVPLRMSEMEAVECALAWARPGDVLVLLIHSLAARNSVVKMLGVEGGPVAR